MQLTERDSDDTRGDAGSPPGHRSGEGLASILPYLQESLRSKPQARPVAAPHDDAPSRRPDSA